VSVAQSKRQHRGRHEFDADRDTQDQPQHTDDVAEPQAAGFRLRDQAGAEPQPSGEQEPEQGRPAHDPETAYLEQGEDDALPKAGPVGGRVLDDQPGNAHRRGCGEECRQEGGRAFPGASGRQHQQACAERDGEEES
jgi:hypothetical protein